ncbi:MAG: DNA polymerase III subunit alpha [Bacteroidales bacterium]
MPSFSHLHVHTQYSILDGAADIELLFKKAKADGMPAIAITDHGNMFGVFEFVAHAAKINKKDPANQVKPIVGCEFYVVNDRHKKHFTRDDRDQRFHQLLLAKNAEGYGNLVKLSSLGFTEGFYSKYPRIDKELILKYHKGLIATTCCLAGEVPRAIMNQGEAKGEEVFRWWLDLFGPDYYIELQRHGIPEQEKVNNVLMDFAARYNVKMIASNDSHYVEQANYNAHDILLCINTGEKKSTPTVKDYGDNEESIKGKRFAFYNDQFYFKNTAEMSKLFEDLPEAIDNTGEIADKVELLELKKDILLPHFVIPEGFQSQDDYLRHLTYEGARIRYKELTPELEERIDFELFTIKTMGFAGYFLIVSDFIKAGRDLGVFVGPGRGSAAGSVVAYCIKITNIDPIKYNLLFERFLNPDRHSMPDIDTDFDDDGRQKVIDYVVDKYGRNQVAQIITFGTMAARSSIKDVARVLEVDIPVSNEMSRLVPERAGIQLFRLLEAPFEGDKGLKEVEKLNAEELEGVKKLRELAGGTDIKAQVIKEALVLSGTVRNTGIHAAGVIIAPKDLMEIIPVATSKESDLLVTQYDGKLIEDAGVIKMDFLGLKTLSIIRDALILIKKNHDIDIDIDTIELNDPKTFGIFQRGETNGIFQFESGGMQKYLKDLQPDKIEDLIAMNALFRPGPKEYIPSYILRKFGKQVIHYDLPAMEEILKDTYGITVYQEQVMLLSQKLAGFGKGDADTLRKAMGKKNMEELNKKKTMFMEGCEKNGHDLKICEKIWTDWEAFASYAFNKSHSTCYAIVAYQTAFLKAHYTAEFMASTLTHNLSDIKKITFFIDECKRMSVKVLGPDVNESVIDFSVNKKGEIRFGMAAVKGVGEVAALAIIDERDQNGPFRNIFDLTSRVNLRSVNKRCLEALALAGAFDGFEGTHRAQYFQKEPSEEIIFLEKVIRHGGTAQARLQSAQASLFGEVVESEMPEIRMPFCEPWTFLEQLKKEMEVTGFYMSGHPLDDYRDAIDYFCNVSPGDIKDDLTPYKGKDLGLAGIINMAQQKTTKNGKPMGSFVLEDFSGSYRFTLFSEDYLKMKHFLIDGTSVHIKARVANRFNQPDQFELKIVQMTLLADVMEKFPKQVTLFLPSDEIDELMVDSVAHIVASHKGSCPFKIIVTDKDQQISLELQSKKRITCAGLVHALREYNPDFQLKVN